MMIDSPVHRSPAQQFAIRILVVEDNPNDFDLIRACLNEAEAGGAEILHAATVSEALRTLQVADVQLTLLDLALPDSMGMDALERLPLEASGPVIVVTGRESPSLLKDALSLRAYDVLSKQDLTPANLMRLVRLAQMQYETETELRKTEGRFRQVFEHSPDAIFVHTEERVIFANPAAVKMLRAESEAQIVGLSIWKILHPDRHAASRARIARLAAGESLTFQENRYLRFDGTAVDVEVALAPFEFKGRVGIQASARDITERKARDAALQEAERFARSTIDAPQNKNICVLDETGTILTTNKAWREFAEENEAAHQSAYEGVNYLEVCARSTDADARAVAEGIRGVMQDDKKVFEHEYPCHSPTEQRWFVARVSRFVGEGPLRLVVAHENITEKKRAVLGTIRMAKTYAALSSTNEAVFRIEEENVLFRRVCEIAVDLGELRLAAIRLIDPLNGWLRPVAVSGEPKEFFAYVPVSVHPDLAEGRKPTVVAARAGRSLVCNDCLADPGFALWHELMAGAGIAATMGIPLRRGGRVIGMLSLFAGERGWFDASLEALFERMAENLSFALGNIDRKSLRKAAEDRLRDSEARFRSLTDLSSDWYWEMDEAYRLTGAERTEGQTPIAQANVFFGQRQWDNPHTNLSKADWAAYRDLLDARRVLRDFEYYRCGPDGNWRWVSISGEPVFDVDGKFTGYRGVTKDVTDRKRTEQVRTLEHAIARHFAEAADVAEGMHAVLKAVCESEGWDFGRYWAQDAAGGHIQAGPAWCVPSPAIARYLEDTRELGLPPGFGIISEVRRSAEPVWIRDAQEDNRVAQAGFKAVAGMRGTFLLPVSAEGRTIGVIVFASRQARDPDPHMLAAARAIGGQVGQVLLRKESEDALRRFRAALDLSADSIYLVDARTLAIVDCNEGACRELGYEREDLVGASIEKVIAGRTREEIAAAYSKLAGGEPEVEWIDALYRRKDGSEFPVEIHRRALVAELGGSILVVARNITDRKRIEQDLRASHERFEIVARATMDAVWDWDVTSDEIWWNANFSTVFGHPQAEFQSRIRSWMPRIHPEDHDRVVESILSTVDGERQAWTCEYRFQRADGTYAHVLDRGTVIRDPQGVPIRMIGAMADVTERKAAEEKLAYLAQFDSLTGLPNRALLRDRLEQAAMRARRHNRSVGVLFVDLDRFKLVNDSLGHHIGDRLLVAVAERLRACVREGDTIGRISGDEFAVVLEDMAQGDDAAMVARKILDAFKLPFSLEGHETFVTASIGASVFADDSEDPDALLKYADAAMYSAKEAGRNRFAFYTAELNERSSARLRLSTELRHAIERREFVLHFQPKANLATGQVSGFEALLRWQHPVRGLVSPLEFIPVLEDTGLIVPVGEWVLRSACEQIQSWKAVGLDPCPVAVNLSMRQFQQKNLDEVVGGILSDTGIDPGMIELELTESALMSDAEETVRVLNALKLRGLRLSVDDFGTGYSSLAYLKRFPIDCLKIDRAFIRDCIADPDDAAIALAVIGLAHTLNLKVVAEGVETEAQLNFLRSHGCDEIQGYYFSRPVPAVECARMLAEGSRLRFSAAQDTGAARTILVVDDYKYDRELMREVLEPAGYRVLDASNPPAALELLANHAIDVVISDHSMPGMSGVKFLSGVRQLYPGVVRILFSGSGDASAATDGVNHAGIHKYLSKNWEAARMRMEIREALLRQGEEEARL